MSRQMLIDAQSEDLIRLSILTEGCLEEFDCELRTRKPLKGNVYLAKVAHVEPALQAAFVEYGGVRHGFIPITEIHPDYYRIPIADRDELIAEAAEERCQAVEANLERESADQEGGGRSHRQRSSLRGRYKIQEVIKRRQILLVQVTKEERSGKGAALTTYLSFAGRYCVLMPNTSHGGGVSRKIADAKDRQRLKETLDSVDLFPGMSLILRTAGAGRTKTEIKRDCDYLLRLWEDVRQRTLQSVAPALVYEEADLVRRAVRDLYDRDIDEILVAGESAYRSAKDSMKMLMPSHARKVKSFKKDNVNLFDHFGIRHELEKLQDREVSLPSGGSLVIWPTEALISIDVNSGKATRERHIEATALKTNLEAAEEIARQLRLRDLGGLIVIDFIDMEESKHAVQIERCLRESLRRDRARTQVGRISNFGLLEMSRQRLRPSLQDLMSRSCPVCSGTGVVRSVESLALRAIAAIEEKIESQQEKQGSQELKVVLAMDVAFYLLNQKRTYLASLEKQADIHLNICGLHDVKAEALSIEWIAASDSHQSLSLIAQDSTEKAETTDSDAGNHASSRRKRRRGRRGGARSRDSNSTRPDLHLPENMGHSAASSSDEASQINQEEKDLLQTANPDGQIESVEFPPSPRLRPGPSRQSRSRRGRATSRADSNHIAADQKKEIEGKETESIDAASVVSDHDDHHGQDISLPPARSVVNDDTKKEAQSKKRWWSRMLE